MSADEKATFAIELKDETSGAAMNAAAALSTLKKKIDEDTKALSAMQAAMRRLKSGTSTNVEAFRQLNDQIAAQKAKLANAQAAYVSLGGTFGAQVAGGATSASDALSGLLAFVRAMPAPIAAAIGILTAFAAATAAVTVALLRYGLAQADARRSELLRLEGLTMLRSRFAAVAGSATEMQAAIDRAAASTALGREQVAGMSEGLYRAGLRGSAFSDTLQALSVVETALGEAGARRFRGRLIMEARAGRSTQALANIQSRFGALAHRQMLSLNVQSRKLHESFAAIFSGLEIEGFLEGLHSITELFSQNTASGRALKTIAEAVFQPMIDAITSLAPLGRRFFQGLVIGALLLVIAVQRVATGWRRLFGDSNLLGDLDTLQLALWVGIAAFGAMAVIGGTLAASLLVIAGSAALLVAPLVAAGIAIAQLLEAGVRLAAWFDGQDWAALGSALVDGLVNGIRSGASRVTQSVQGLAGAARAALTQALGIASPSRVFAALGQQIPRGLAVGVDRAAPIAAGAVDEMAEGTVPSARGGGSSVAISIGDVIVNAQGGDARELARSFRDELARVLEGVGITVGAPA